MTLSDLKPGYVVQQRDGELFLVMPNRHAHANGELIITNGRHWADLAHYSEDMYCKWGTSTYRAECDIVAVYDHPARFAASSEITTFERRLLWKREDPKKMTVKEICEALGYDVEIVRDDNA